MTRHLLVAALALLALPPRATALTVFAAASLSDALQEIARTYESASGSEKIVFNFAGSSLLARQIKEGAPADLFFSADEAKMDDLANSGLIVADTRRSLLSNTLVIIVNDDGGPPLAVPADLAKNSVRRLALAEPQTVPAGIYAKNWLQKIALWEKLSPKIVPTENVRACLAAVESGNADAGIVYQTDALISKKVRVAFAVPLPDAPKISYPLALVKNSAHAEAARKFAAFLASDAARVIFTKYGFLSAR